jgi:hypothetical protein
MYPFLELSSQHVDLVLLLLVKGLELPDKIALPLVFRDCF